MITERNMREPSEVASDRLSRLLDRQSRLLSSVCPERARLLTESMRDTEGSPQVLRLALGLRHVLERQTVFIGEEELIAGNASGRPGGRPYFPEHGASPTFIERALSEEGMDDALAYWRGRTLPEVASRLCPPEVQQEEETGTFMCALAQHGLGHIIVDYPRVLGLGFFGLLEEANRKLAGLRYEDPADISRAVFYRAAAIALGGAMTFARRHGELAFSMAEREANPQRQKELRDIAATCMWVAGNTPRTFREALQLFWFAHLVLQIESNGQSISVGRFDQYMYPFFRHDLEEGRLSRQEAAELLESLWVKFFDIRKLFTWEKIGRYLPGEGLGMVQNLTVGGLTPDGQDATNELSYLAIETSKRVRGVEPALSVRVHDTTPDALLAAACELAKLGTGHPHFFNDKAHVPAWLARGVSLKDARNWAPVGCEEVRTSGCDLGVETGVWVILPRCLELAVLDESRECTSFDDVFAAYKERVERAARSMVIACNSGELAHKALLPYPFVSALVRGCLDKGLPLIEGGATYNFSAVRAAGLATVADGLAAIRKLVFEDSEITMEQLRSAMRSNFGDREGQRVRHLVLEKVPKYGNDEDEVDQLARAVGEHVCRLAPSYRTPRGGSFVAGLYTGPANVGLGAVCGATPDGRLAGHALSDNVSPAEGRDRKGPTAAINSVGKVDHISSPEGTGLTLHFVPEVLAGETGTRNLAALVRGHFDKLAMHVQFNVIGADVLRDAQQHPEKYRNLVVRISGFSAQFIHLDRQTQDHIIGRTEHRL